MQPDLHTLSQQCETAGPEETGRLLWHAFRLLDPEATDARYGAFKALLDINTQEAFLGAAAMLVPEGWAVERAGWHSLGEPSAFFQLWQYRHEAGKWRHGSGEQRAEGEAATPALALLSAILRAEAAKQEKV